MPDYPVGPPHFKTEEELHRLIQEALDDPRPAVVMTEDEWQRLYNEVVPSRGIRKLAS